MPAALRRGIANLRLFAGPGCRVVLGGPGWEKRVKALQTNWPVTGFGADDFQRHISAFWRHAVWIAKKILRGELRAALRWHQIELREHVYALLEEEARLAGRRPRPEARQAEQWLTERRLGQTAEALSVDQAGLSRALLAEIALFEELSSAVAPAHRLRPTDYSAVAAWLRTELAKVARTGG
jgi:hypothetical protein